MNVLLYLGKTPIFNKTSGMLFLSTNVIFQFTLMEDNISFEFLVACVCADPNQIFDQG